MEAALNSTTLGRTPLTSSTLKIGRAADNQLVLTDPQVSSHHAEITPTPGGDGYQVTDLNSRNGTFVNEQRLTPNTPRQFNPNDTLRFGATSFTYEGPGTYAATQLASPSNYEPTVLASPASTPEPAQPGNYTPPAYPQSQPGYPQSQPGFSQPGYPQSQPGYPQPGYPQQPGFQQQPGYPMHQNVTPGYAPPRKSSAGLWITLVILLIVVGGGGTFAFFTLRSTPEKTLQAYCDALMKKDADGMYAQLSKKSQAQTSPSKIQQGLASLSVLGVEIKSCTVGKVTQISDTKATGSITITAASTKTGETRSEPSSGPMINENGTWKMDEVSDQSLPSQ